MPPDSNKSCRTPCTFPFPALSKVYTHTPASQADTMPADFNGRWILETSDKFEEYLKVLSKKLSLLFGFLFVRRYLSSVLRGDVTAWTSSTRNKIIQFHALLIFLWKVFLCVTVWFNVERVHWGFSEAISPQKTMISNTEKLSDFKMIPCLSRMIRYHG